ncbi:MAG: HAD-superfamily hydrolase subfamily IA, variant 3 [Candidatus Ozemobacter sibiricus]|uniref:HAD-superfamily hydrolase subfamily IA, variant 3 n=1 Tax=Candidatus Ozemobacter sibiricus TaxID=2268124 RepID=A0A367ZKG9_9BACT|nr:MAG: HAD-superfamily hydrolase subfamily IA, variant 3 [Candidatus Ozemobacter sibiricus]
MLRHPIRLVLFDYGNVISLVDHRRFLTNLQPLGKFDDQALWRDIFEGPAPALRQLETGAISTATFFARVAAFFRGTAPSQEALIEAFCDLFEPVPATRALLARLRGRYRIGLLSNTSRLHFERVIRDREVFPCFDQVTMSWEVGAMKPDPRIFQDALAKFGGPPAEVVYLDDIAAYVEAARALGMQALQITDPAVQMPALATALGVV